MKLMLTKLENIALTIITILPSLYPSFLLLLVRLGDYIVNLFDLYSYKLIGKLTGFLQLQEFTLRNLPVVSSTSSAQCLYVVRPHFAFAPVSTVLRSARTSDWSDCEGLTYHFLSPYVSSSTGHSCRTASHPNKQHNNSERTALAALSHSLLSSNSTSKPWCCGSVKTPNLSVCTRWRLRVKARPKTYYQLIGIPSFSSKSIDEKVTPGYQQTFTPEKPSVHEVCRPLSFSF
jgi:hypothetical protein